MTSSSNDQPTTIQPMFYRSLEPLHLIDHAGWRLKPGDAGFSAQTPFVPIVVGEIAAAARDYPVVFATGNAQPLAILGLERRNLFVDAGDWHQDAYVPAYVRRYPFGFIATSEPDRFALGIDTGSERIAIEGEEGVPLFEGDAPSALTRQALAFCEAFQGEATATRAFADALLAQGLLVDRRVDAVLDDGRKYGLEGFQVIDAAKLDALPEAVVVEWHRNGWLALAALHLASMERFARLLGRQAKVRPTSSIGAARMTPVQA